MPERLGVSQGLCIISLPSILWKGSWSKVGKSLSLMILLAEGANQYLPQLLLLLLIQQTQLNGQTLSSSTTWLSKIILDSAPRMILSSYTTDFSHMSANLHLYQKAKKNARKRSESIVARHVAHQIRECHLRRDAKICHTLIAQASSAPHKPHFITYLPSFAPLIPALLADNKSATKLLSWENTPNPLLSLPVTSTMHQNKIYMYNSNSLIVSDPSKSQESDTADRGLLNLNRQNFSKNIEAQEVTPTRNKSR